MATVVRYVSLRLAWSLICGPIVFGVLIASNAGGRMIVMTARRRKSPEQIARLLGQADRLLANGSDVATVCRNCSSPNPATTGGVKATAARTSMTPSV